MPGAALAPTPHHQRNSKKDATLDDTTPSTPSRRTVRTPTTAPMSPNVAAQLISVSRRSIMRAIDAKELKAFRDNRNNWKITPADLDAWAGDQLAHSAQAPTTSPPEPTEQSPIIKALQADLNAEKDARHAAQIDAAQLRGTLAATIGERDSLRQIIDRMTSPPRSFWRWPR